MKNHKEWVEDIFDKAAPGYGQKETAFFDYFGARLAQLSGIKTGNHILDIATGRGAVLFPASELTGKSGRIFGVDISSQMLELTRRDVLHKKISNIELQKMDAENLTFPNGSFDCVLCGFALFFFPSLRRALQEIRRVLKPKGKVAVTIWGKKPYLSHWVVDECKKLSKNHKSLAKTQIYDDETLCTFLEEAHFENITITEEKKQFSYACAKDWWESLWTHGTRASLEKLTNEQLLELKKQALEKARKLTNKSRISEEFQVFYATATKSSLQKIKIKDPKNENRCYI